MDLYDIFYVEKTDKENEEKIMNIENQNEISTVKNAAYNEGYLEESTKKYDVIYNKSLDKGVKYSLEFGKLLGKIDAIEYIINMNNTIIDSKNIKDLNEIKSKLENYSEKITDNLLNECNYKINNILDGISKLFN